MKTTRQKGNTCESIVSEYLISKGYFVLAKNYLKKWGEIDIVCKKGGIVHFVEVKGVYYSGDYSEMDIHRPEDNVHALKLRHLRRVIESYLWEFHKGQDVEFLVHVVCVYMNTITNKSKIEMIENVII